MSAPGSLIAALRAEADLIDILHAPGDAIVRVEAIAGKWTIETVTWIYGERRQRYGRGESFVGAWKAMVDGGAG